MAKAQRSRLDVLLVERGLAPSRERARALVLAGRVEVDGRIQNKAGCAVDHAAALRLIEPDHPYVGRGGLKLAHALTAFHVAVEGRLALDIGASTGGFTDVLLRGGAAHVIALDVGHGQFAWKLRADPRVTVIEGLNARTLSLADLPTSAAPVDLVTIDVSFITVRHILPRLPAVLRPDADVIVLVKPQFESRREEVGAGGIIRDQTVRDRVVTEVVEAARALGFTVRGTCESPITGTEGNVEYLAHFGWQGAVR